VSRCSFVAHTQWQQEEGASLNALRLRMRLALQQQTANFKLAISRRAMQRSFLTETKKIMIRRKGAWTNERKNSSGRNNARQRKTNTLRCAPASDALLRTLNHK
jgi:hypothetical protein